MHRQWKNAAQGRKRERRKYRKERLEKKKKRAKRTTIIKGRYIHTHIQSRTAVLSRVPTHTLTHAKTNVAYYNLMHPSPSQFGLFLSFSHAPESTHRPIHSPARWCEKGQQLVKQREVERTVSFFCHAPSSLPFFFSTLTFRRKKTLKEKKTKNNKHV